MDAFGGPVRLVIRRSEQARMLRLGAALMVVLCWLGLQVADVVLSVMLFSEPNFPDVLLVTAPMLLLVPWIVAMATAEGAVEVSHDALVIRHRRVLRRPLVLSRGQVRRIILDDGAATGRARFATGDPSEPLLWTDPVVRRQHDDRPLIGDALLPNLAIELDPSLPMEAARDGLTAVPAAAQIDPPRRRGRARALLMTMQDLEATRRALVGWPVEVPDTTRVIPPQVAAGAAQVPRDATTILVLCSVTALLLALRLYALVPFAFAIQVAFVVQMHRRRRAAAETAREEVRRRTLLSPQERATALAAIDANLAGGSVPPPGA